MSVLGPLAKGLAFLIGKQPEERAPAAGLSRSLSGPRRMRQVKSGSSSLAFLMVHRLLREEFNRATVLFEINDRAIRASRTCAQCLDRHSRRRSGGLDGRSWVGDPEPRRQIDADRWGGSLSHECARFWAACMWSRAI